MLMNEKKKWQAPVLDVLNVDQTMASAHIGKYDEGYNEALGEEGQTNTHHGS
ncbi:MULTISPECIES: paeninodin family lasso peptide [Paenibacillus]|uniref:Paeninodin family lasso peptide n=1 Tax=Paenibacillus radicis (ex Xue et al. 2023) TaxID=2972489 RepID=A0ABT1YQC5_9BACL|nr:paeninodin family lasso peptide [Paenibacillus radicis (ex Xue et al. 2023)]MCR8635379.1 paeninodin family lasso peptide [Paenibacillus radicis (ex Xue et al. 2023)]